MGIAIGGAACVDGAVGDEAEGQTSSEAQVRPIDPAKELMITDPSVIRDPFYTAFDPDRPSGSSDRGAWSFGRLVHNMLPDGQRDSPAAASALVLRWLATWEEQQAPNPLVSPAKARPAIRTLITNPWKTASGCVDPSSPATDASCVLDMARAPFQLIAIANRPDLRIIANDDTAIGGEGRFVFQVEGPTLGVDETTKAVRVMDATSSAQKFTVIFEYSLPVSHPHQTLHWADRWHALGTLELGPQFNRALERITNDFSRPDADRRRPNGNALNQIRTNEVALMGARFPEPGFIGASQFWELREFRLTTSGLAPHTVNLEPARDFDIRRPLSTGTEGTRSAELSSFLVANEAAVVASKFQLPPGMSANSALVGSAPYGAWGKLSATGAHSFVGASVPARDSFALNTCAGCHRHETDTRHFMHITQVGAMELDRAAPLTPVVEDRARVGVSNSTPDGVVVLSNVLAVDIAPGGGRFEDFARLLVTSPNELRNRPGRRTH